MLQGAPSVGATRVPFLTIAELKTMGAFASHEESSREPITMI